jgi:hypothetical protein
MRAKITKFPGQSKDHQIDIYGFSVKHPALRRKTKGWLTRHQDNVFEWSDTSTKRVGKNVNVEHLNLFFHNLNYNL